VIGLDALIALRTDSLSSAVNNMSNLEEFNRRYECGITG
jgi:hypothetical protein